MLQRFGYRLEQCAKIDKNFKSDQGHDPTYTAFLLLLHCSVRHFEVLKPTQTHMLEGLAALGGITLAEMLHGDKRTLIM